MHGNPEATALRVHRVRRCSFQQSVIHPTCRVAARMSWTCVDQSMLSQLCIDTDTNKDKKIVLNSQPQQTQHNKTQTRDQQGNVLSNTYQLKTPSTACVFHLQATMHNRTRNVVEDLKDQPKGNMMRNRMMAMNQVSLQNQPKNTKHEEVNLSAPQLQRSYWSVKNMKSSKLRVSPTLRHIWSNPKSTQDVCIKELYHKQDGLVHEWHKSGTNLSRNAQPLRIKLQRSQMPCAGAWRCKLGMNWFMYNIYIYISFNLIFLKIISTLIVWFSLFADPIFSQIEYEVNLVSGD